VSSKQKAPPGCKKEFLLNNLVQISKSSTNQFEKTLILEKKMDTVPKMKLK